MAENEIPQRPAEGKPFEKPDEEDFSFGYLSSEARSAYQSVLDQLREEFSGTTPTDEEINERIADYLSYLSPQITAALTPFEVKMRVDLQKVLQKESDKGKTEDLVEPSETEPEELEKWLKKKKQTILNELINFDKKNRKETLSDEEKKQIRSEFFNIINPVLAEIDEIRNRHQDDSQLQAFIQDIDSIKTAFFRKWPVEKSEEESPNPSSKDENVAEPRAEEQKDPQNPNEPENSKDSGNPEGPENAEEWVEKQRERFQVDFSVFNANLLLEGFEKKRLSKEEESRFRIMVKDFIKKFYEEAIRMLYYASEDDKDVLKDWSKELLDKKDELLKDWLSLKENEDESENENENENKLDQWKVLFDKKWQILDSTYRARESTDPAMLQLMTELSEIVDEHFSETEKKVYERALLLRDVANMHAGPFRHLCLKDIEGAHKKSFLNEGSELREYMGTKEVFGVPLSEVINFVESDAFDKLQHTTSWGHTYNWSYAANGDPEEDQKYSKEDSEKLKEINLSTDERESIEKRKVLTMRELLTDKFPSFKEAPSFVLDSVITFIIVSELRYKKFYPFYDFYQNSPINGMNAEAILPWGIPGFIAYKVASVTKLPGYMSCLILTRYPSKPSSFQLRKNTGEYDFVPKGDLSSNGKEYINSLDPNYRAVNVSFDKNWAYGRFKKIPEFVEDRSWTFVDDTTSTGQEKFNRCINALIDKRKNLILVRNFLNWTLSPRQIFPSVELNPDMQILPSTWDVIKGEWRGQKISMTLDDLFAVYKEFDSFAKKIDGNPQIEKPEDIAALLADLISDTSKFKVILAKFPSRIPEFESLTKLISYMYLLYLKKLFDQYLKLPIQRKVNESFKLKSQLFAEIVKKEVESDKTLPSVVAKEIVSVMDEISANSLIASTEWGLIFYNSNIKDTEPYKFKLERVFGGSESWLKQPSPKEKDPKEG